MSRDTDEDMWQLYYTAIGGNFVHVIRTYQLYIKNEKLLDLNNNRSKPEFFRLLWDIFVSDRFRTFCLTLKLFIEKFWYNFGAVLYKFFETGTSDRTLIYFDQLLKFLGFSI